ncbi:hypothetical protein FA95DRAFT_87774 [Auriscalpium vulgare]|uniref:Uncharacterized protein n=1 Tax=Auriscalpium vulgare TaxID=40419 RepID=A0ACB8RNS3_9AGAM|nr:hypothetical protein FA95DRAFT_87774 [Auriscalpium vulgare]
MSSRCLSDNTALPPPTTTLLIPLLLTHSNHALYAHANQHHAYATHDSWLSLERQEASSIQRDNQSRCSTGCQSCRGTTRPVPSRTPHDGRGQKAPHPMPRRREQPPLR